MLEIEESVVVFCHHKVIHKLLNESLQEFTPVSIIGGQSDTFNTSDFFLRSMTCFCNSFRSEARLFSKTIAFPFSFT